MTTIAYKDGVIACDSRSTQGDVIIDDNTDKFYKYNGAVFAFCGQVPAYKNVIAGFFGEDIKEMDFCASGLAYYANKLYALGYHEKGYWQEEWRIDRPYADGSGRDHAYTAMDMGATAKEAVKLAMKRDANSGGRVRTYKFL